MSSKQAKKKRRDTKPASNSYCPCCGSADITYEPGYYAGRVHLEKSPITGLEVLLVTEPAKVLVLA